MNRHLNLASNAHERVTGNQDGAITSLTSALGRRTKISPGSNSTGGRLIVAVAAPESCWSRRAQKYREFPQKLLFDVITFDVLLLQNKIRACAIVKGRVLLTCTSSELFNLCRDDVPTLGLRARAVQVCRFTGGPLDVRARIVS